MSTLTPARITGKPASKTAAVKPAPVPVEAPADPWASVLAEAVIAPAFVRGPRVANLEVPAPVKLILEQSLSEWGTEVVDPNGKTLAVGTAKFRTFNAGTISRAKEFIAFAKAWARDRDNGQVSVRAFQIKEGKAETTVVKFAAMPLVKNETRAMTAANGASSADVRKWAQETGISVPDRGKLKPEVFAAYNAANPAGDPNQTTIDEA